MNIIGIDYGFREGATAIVVLNTIARQVVYSNLATIAPAHLIDELRFLNAAYKPNSIWLDVPPMVSSFVDLWRAEGLPLIVYAGNNQSVRQHRTELLMALLECEVIILDDDEKQLLRVNSHFREALELVAWGSQHSTPGISFV